MSADQSRGGAAPPEAPHRSPGAAPRTRAAPPPAPDLDHPEHEPRVLGGAILRSLERAFLLFDRLVGATIPDQLNPFLHTGAVATMSLIVATASGILLLFWYRPSVHQAFPSVAAMASTPWTAGLLRSLHRYGSDAAIFFTLVHALRVFFERRFTGPRWLAWVTGVTAVAALWFVGWTGYWLVWDTRAHAVAVGTARTLDVLPMFSDPMGRSFLTDGSLNSLLFFVVFFIHMLVPLLVVVLLVLHLARLARSRWVTRVPLTIWTLGMLLALSAVMPADSAAPAHMSEIRRSYTIDAWYLAPIALTDRLGGGALWSALLVAGTVLGTMPWWMKRRRLRVATIHPERCTACTQCYTDCPYNAITMIPRTDGSSKYDRQANVDATKCVGCGICAASCDTLGTNLEGFSTVTELRLLDDWLPLGSDAVEAPVVVFRCAHAAGAEFDVDPANGRCAGLAGARVLAIPCVGWLHALMIERVLRRGAAHVVVASCGPGECHYREGNEWLRQRVEGERGPSPRAEFAPRERLHILALDRTRGRDLRRMVAALSSGAGVAGSVAPGPARPTRALAGAAAAVLAALVATGVGAASQWRYTSPAYPGSELVVTFKHPGQVSEHYRDLSAAELEKIPVHMRRQRVYARARAAVRMRVTVDGERVVGRAYAPTGLWHDGNSIAVEMLPVPTGEHVVSVAISDSHDPDDWSFRTVQRLTFAREARRVIVFDRSSGFTVH